MSVLYLNSVHKELLQYKVKFPIRKIGILQAILSKTMLVNHIEAAD